MATIIITENASELLKLAVARAAQDDDSSAIAAAIGTVDRETYLGLLAGWKIAYALKADEIRRLKSDRAAPAPTVDATLPEAEREAAAKIRKKALAAKDSAHWARCEQRHEARRLMEVRLALKQMARANAAARKAA